MTDLTIHEIAHHRNGVGGEDFHVVTFACPEGGEMIGILFGLETDHDEVKWNGRCAVLNRDLLADGVIKFGRNSWRGDQYEAELREAIEYEEKHGWRKSIW